MKIKFLFISCFSILWIGSMSCGSSKSKIEDAILWKISGNGLETPSYLLGTNHTIKLGFLDSVPQFWDIYHSVECLIVEIDITDKKVMDNIKTSKEDDYETYLMPVDTTYQMLYSSSDYHYVDSVLKEKGWTLYQKFMPEFIACRLLDSEILVSEDGCMDIELTLKARKDQKEIVGLDDMELLKKYEESNAIAGLKEQAETLLEAVTYVDEVREKRIWMDSLYCQQKMTTLTDEYIASIFSKLGSQELEIEESVDDTLFIERNKDWLKKIPAYIGQKSSLIAVGFKHLIGDADKYGLIHRLRALGYTVTPVKD